MPRQCRHAVALGRPLHIARNAFAARTSLILYNEAGSDALTDIVRGVHGG